MIVVMWSTAILIKNSASAASGKDREKLEKRLVKINIGELIKPDWGFPYFILKESV